MKILLFANTDWYLYNYRLPLARALCERGLDVVLLSPPGDYVPRLQELGLRWSAFPMSRKGMNPFLELVTILRLANMYRREEPHLIHHFTVKCVLYGSLAGRLTGVPLIINSVTGLGYIFTGGNATRKLLRAFVKVLYRLSLRGTHLIFQNEEDRQVFLSNGLVRSEHSRVIQGSGVDISFFTPTPEPEGTPVVMMATRMLWDKGVGDFVEAARRLCSLGLEARFVLVGNTYPDNPAAVPAAQLQNWHDEGIVEWWGWRDDMREVLSQASIVCLPSYYKEGLPKILTEAAACGRPIITTDTPGCRDVVRNGLSGLLIRPKDVDGLIQAISLLLENPVLRFRMGSAGRSLAEELFSTERIVRETLHVYKEAGLEDLNL